MFTEYKYLFFFLILTILLSSTSMASCEIENKWDCEPYPSVNCPDITNIQYPDSTLLWPINQNVTVESVNENVQKVNSQENTLKESQDTQHKTSIFSFAITLFHQLFQYIF